MTLDGALLVPAAIGLATGAGLSFVVWLRSLGRQDVSIVDAAWGFLVWLPGAVAALVLQQIHHRAWPLLVLVLLWALRLALHILRRHRGQPEDARYQAIRARNQPHFEWKSLYLVFGLQAVLGWIVALPMLGAAASTTPWHAVDFVGFAAMVFGLGFEAIADAQLTRFKAGAAQKGKVLDSGLWRYSRHPNYFGECCFWWGVWLVALAGGAWWAVVSPLLMTVLLLKVSGVALLEKDIGTRRPAYADYVRRTNAFIPGRPRA